MLRPASNDFAIFKAKNHDVGDVVIEEDGNELIVFVGNITHGHFGSYESGLSEAEHEEVVAESLVDFLVELFADEILLFKSDWKGGWARREMVNEKDLLFPETEWFAWSGPIKSVRL